MRYSPCDLEKWRANLIASYSRQRVKTVAAGTGGAGCYVSAKMMRGSVAEL
jgi:hypothetical protein